MPREDDSVEERRKKVSRLENMVHEHHKQLYRPEVDKDYYLQVSSDVKAHCFNDLRKKFYPKN